MDSKAMQTMADDPQLEDDKSLSKVAIIDENYCTQKSQEFIVLKKMTKFQTNAVFQVFDVDQNLLLQADGLNWLLHRTFLMKDSHDSPIVTLHEARITDKRRWDVYEGDSTDAPDHMFKVQRTSAFQVNARLDILFLDNPNPEEARFQIKKDDASSNTSAMYQGSRIIARVKHRNTWKNFLQGKDVLKVEVTEGIDYAFVMSVLIIMGNAI